MLIFVSMAAPQLFNFWLNFWLDNGLFPELLFWRDKLLGIFRILYCHGNKRNRRLDVKESSLVFMAWDRVKKRPPCVTGEDYSRSKMRFRQALKSLTERGFIRRISSAKSYQEFQVITDRVSGLVAGRNGRSDSLSSSSPSISAGTSPTASQSSQPSPTTIQPSETAIGLSPTTIQLSPTTIQPSATTIQASPIASLASLIIYEIVTVPMEAVSINKSPTESANPSIGPGVESGLLQDFPESDSGFPVEHGLPSVDDPGLMDGFDGGPMWSEPGFM